MRVAHRIVHSCILAAAACAIGATPAAQQSAQEATLIAGAIIDAQTGKPIEGALVSSYRLNTTPPNMRKAVTDAQGHFVLTDVLPGRREVIAEAPGYDSSRLGQLTARGSSHTLEMIAGQPVSGLAISLWKLSVLSGSVTDESGEPIVGVNVQAWRRQADTRVFGRSIFALQSTSLLSTDDRGRYRIPVPPGEYLVALPSSIFATTRIGSSSVEGSAPAGPSMTIGDLRLQIADASSSLLRAIPPPPRTDGRVFAYTTTFHPAAITPATALVIVAGAGEELGGLNLQTRLAPTVSVSGRVTSESGPLKNGRVRLSPAFASDFTTSARQDFTLSTAVTDADGRFELVGVPAGEYSLRSIEISATTSGPAASIRSANGQAMSMGSIGSVSGVRPGDDVTLWAEVPLSVGNEPIRDLAVSLKRGSRVSGRLVFEGGGTQPQPADLQRVTVSLVAIAQLTWPLPSAPVRADGTFVTSEQPAGRYTLTIATPPAGWMLRSAMLDGRDITDRAFALQSDLSDISVVFTRQSTSVSGVVRGAQGLPYGDASVLLFPADFRDRAGDGVRPGRVQRARTGPSGAYSFAPVPEGDYFLIALPDRSLPDLWQSPRLIQSYAALASRVILKLGDAAVQNLRAQAVR